jgi:hypothetical protein
MAYVQIQVDKYRYSIIMSATKPKVVCNGGMVKYYFFIGGMVVDKTVFFSRMYRSKC